MDNLDGQKVITTFGFGEVVDSFGGGYLVKLLKPNLLPRGMRYLHSVSGSIALYAYEFSIITDPDILKTYEAEAANG